MLTAREKAKVIGKIRIHEKDTGSAEVQIAVLSRQIERLSEHLRTHRKDHHSRRGLLAMVVRRKKLLDYLKKKSDPKRYTALAQALRLKTPKAPAA